MTLSQLRTFALVARLGSLRAAAAALGVSEPAVSSALAALRSDLDDPLFVRAGGGIALTPGGRALADHAQEIVGLAEQARWEVAHARTSTGQLRVAATAAFAEHAAGRLLDAFTKRVPGSSVDLTVEAACDLGPHLVNHACDLALGARPGATNSRAMDLVPFLRYQRIIVAAATHPLSRRPGVVALDELLAHPWFCGPGGMKETTEEGRWLSSLASAPDVVALACEADAAAAVRAGDGIMLALGHVVRTDLRAGSLVRLNVTGTPLSGLWWASTLSQTSTSARVLQRFVTTPAATVAMVTSGTSRDLARRGSKVRVALWS